MSNDQIPLLRAAITSLSNRVQALEFELRKMELNHRDLPEIGNQNYALTETSLDWIWEVNERWVFIFSNSKVIDVLGYKPDEIVGKTPFEFMHAGEAKRVGKIFDQHRTKKHSLLLFESFYIQSSGHVILLETNAVPIFDETKSVIGYRGANRKITECKKTLDPAKQVVTIPKVEDPINIISTEKLLHGSSAFVKMKMDSDFALAVLIEENIWPIEVNSSQIKLALQNIMTNSVESMTMDSVILIQAENVTLQNSMDLPLSDGRYVRIEIADRGCGIPEKSLKNILDPYFSTKGKDRGLGLSIAYSVINKYKGYLKIESKGGMGTTVTIYLPASEKKKLGIEEKCKIMKGGCKLFMDELEALGKSFCSTCTSTETGIVHRKLHKFRNEIPKPYKWTELNKIKKPFV
jgi:PAS domain S-box-containing protein